MFSACKWGSVRASECPFYSSHQSMPLRVHEATMGIQKARGTQQLTGLGNTPNRQLSAFRQQMVPLCHDASCCSLPTDTGPTQRGFWGSLWGTCPGAQGKMSTGSAYPHLTRKGLLTLAPPPASKTNKMSVTLVAMAWQLPQNEGSRNPTPTETIQYYHLSDTGNSFAQTGAYDG